MQMFRLYLVAFFLIFSAFAQADEEDFFKSSLVTINCGSHPQTGEVTVMLEIKQTNITSFKATAFGKKFQLSNKELSKLQTFSFINLHTTHSAGYKELGGHTIYFKFIKNHSYNNTNPKKEYTVVSLTENKGISVYSYTK